MSSDFGPPEGHRTEDEAWVYVKRRLAPVEMLGRECRDLWQLDGHGVLCQQLDLSQFEIDSVARMANLYSTYALLINQPRLPIPGYYRRMAIEFDAYMRSEAYMARVVVAATRALNRYRAWEHPDRYTN